MPTSIAKELDQLTLAIPGQILYILYYRQGANPHPLFISFWHESKDMKIISERVKRHCEVMNYRFVYVRPFIVDLNKDENFLDQRNG